MGHVSPWSTETHPDRWPQYVTCIVDGYPTKRRVEGPPTKAQHDYVKVREDVEHHRRLPCTDDFTDELVFRSRSTAELIHYARSSPEALARALAERLDELHNGDCCRCGQQAHHIGPHHDR